MVGIGLATRVLKVNIAELRRGETILPLKPGVGLPSSEDDLHRDLLAQDNNHKTTTSHRTSASFIHRSLHRTTLVKTGSARLSQCFALSSERPAHRSIFKPASTSWHQKGVRWFWTLSVPKRLLQKSQVLACSIDRKVPVEPGTPFVLQRTFRNPRYGRSSPSRSS